MKIPASNIKALRDRTELDEALGLLDAALSAPASELPGRLPGRLRERVLGRVADSAARHQGMVTVRHRHARVQTPSDDVQVRWLYEADAGRARRRGEPQRLALVELRPGARLEAGLGLAQRHSEWLVVAGSVTLDGLALDTHDHHGHPASAREPQLASAGGATLYLRDNGDEPSPAGTSRERNAQWEPFAPGIRRRLLWQAGEACAFIARAQAGAAVPPHAHLHDEECLMLEGELFAGDILLRQGELQIAPADLHHGLVQAATDCLVYLRGDAEVQLLPSA